MKIACILLGIGAPIEGRNYIWPWENIMQIENNTTLVFAEEKSNSIRSE